MIKWWNDGYREGWKGMMVEWGKGRGEGKGKGKGKGLGWGEGEYCKGNTPT